MSDCKDIIDTEQLFAELEQVATEDNDSPLAAIQHIKILEYEAKGRMTPSRAKQILEGMGLDVIDEEVLYKSNPGRDASILVSFGQNDAYIESATADQLEAIALWMRDPESVTGAEVEG